MNYLSKNDIGIEAVKIKQIFLIKIMIEKTVFKFGDKINTLF